VKIDRAAYLRGALKRHCTPEQIERAIATSPAAAGVSLKVITEAANTSITFETSKVTGISALAGIPGRLAMAGSVPADLAQYLGHVLRISQKLAYTYSWPDLFDEAGDEIDEATQSMLILFVGVMFGVQVAQSGVARVAGMVAANVARRLSQQALTKGMIYPTVKQVARHLGVSMTKSLFANGLAKAIPVVGAVLSGGLTSGTFLPMAKRLQKHLASLELTKPGHRPEEPRAVDVTAIDDGVRKS
jgi:CheY-specific phosphatase CheX